MAVKRCPSCNQWRSIEDFAANRSRPDGKQHYCRTCQRSFVAKHYSANRAYYLAKAKRANARRYAELKATIRALKDVPCTECGVRFPPWMMDFDHVRGTKLFELSQGPRYGGAGILSEAAKCEVVCSNCHRLRTQRRKDMRP